MLRSSMLVALGALVVVNSGCVSLDRYKEMERQNRELAWTLDQADGAIAAKDQQILMLEGEMGVKDGETEVYAQRVERAEDALRVARSEIDQAFEENIRNLSEEVQLEVSPYGGLILEDGILFSAGRYQLRKTAKGVFQSLVSRLQGPEFSSAMIEVAGHTDSDPVVHAKKAGIKSNWDLSARRAEMVLQELMALGIPADRLHLSGYASTRPIGPESTRSEKQRNRRVEIRLHQPGGAAGG